MKILDSIEINDYLKDLDDRQLIIESFLIIEEAIEEVLRTCVPNIDGELLSRNNIARLNFEQKLALVRCYLSPLGSRILSLAKTLQSIRNNVAHNRAFKVTAGEYNNLLKSLSTKDREIFHKSYESAAKITGKDPKKVKSLEARSVLILLVIWFCTLMKKATNE